MYALNSQGMNQDGVCIFKQGPLCSVFDRIITVFVWGLSMEVITCEKFPKEVNV